VNKLFYFALPVTVVLAFVILRPALSQPEESTAMVELDTYTVGQIQAAPLAEIDAENVTFFVTGTNEEVPLDQLVSGALYDFRKIPDAKFAAVIITVPKEETWPTLVRVAKRSDVYSCPNWARPFFGKRCITESYDITYR
jgi:hypothetical protein